MFARRFACALSELAEESVLDDVELVVVLHDPRIVPLVPTYRTSIDVLRSSPAEYRR
jgi:hypothetical protein